MYKTDITADGTYQITKGTTDQSVTAVYLPSGTGTATITIVAEADDGTRLPIPDGEFTESKALFTGIDVPLLAVIENYSAAFSIYTAQ